MPRSGVYSTSTCAAFFFLTGGGELSGVEIAVCRLTGRVTWEGRPGCNDWYCCFSIYDEVDAAVVLTSWVGGWG